MHIVVIGGTGFIGRHLCNKLLERGDTVVVLSRSPSKAAELFPRGAMCFRWKSEKYSEWLHAIEPDCAIVNLAGANIAAGRWNSKRRVAIINSRVETGQALARGLQSTKIRPEVIVQGSAIGYYGHNDNPVDEESPKGTGFLSDVVERWENAGASTIKELGIRRAILRTGMVVGNGGALTKMLPPFRKGLGGPIGKGTQGVSWVHVEDEVRAIIHLIDNKASQGVYNITSPGAINSKELAQALGSVLKRPAFLPVPGFFLKLLYGQMADELLLSGQFVIPKRLHAEGFTFNYEDISAALADAIRQIER
ncbi:MAG: TIGR01777 family oxidoreductase [Desulfovibrio sp.]